MLNKLRFALWLERKFSFSFLLNETFFAIFYSFLAVPGVTQIFFVYLVKSIGLVFLFFFNRSSNAVFN